MSAPAKRRRGAAYLAEIDALLASRYQQDEEDPSEEVPSAEPSPARRVNMMKQLWSKDPSWHFVRSRLRDEDDCDRVIDDLLDTDIPLSRKVRQYIKDNYRCAERRESNRKRSVALIISHEVDRLADWLRDDFTDPKTRAEEYLARHWRKVFGGGFSSGQALNMWVRRHMTSQKTPQKC
jgi:hypothetical protein